MSPRQYNLESRRAASEQTRARVLDATRELIMASAAPPSVEAVAAKAGVARMTVYYQFGSKQGLLEGLFDGLGGPHFRGELPQVMSRAEPPDALDGLIDVFFKFWSTERLVIRRIRAMAALDPDFEQSIRGRDERRRQLLRVILARIAEKFGKPGTDSFDEMTEALYALTSFAMFDHLAPDSGTAEDVVPLIQRLARLALGAHASASDAR